jgi:holo-[acyl-carrier-protein] synthase
MMELFRLSNEIVECHRIRRLIELHGERFLNSIYRSEEMSIAQNHHQSTEIFTGIWAAKRAMSKNLGLSQQRNLDWTQIELKLIQPEEWKIEFDGLIQQRVTELQLTRVEVSISYTRQFALATVLTFR